MTAGQNNSPPGLRNGQTEAEKKSPSVADGLGHKGAKVPLLPRRMLAPRTERDSMSCVIIAQPCANGN